MLLDANLIVYKDAINTYVYCPEIDFAESGELKKDAEYRFYQFYTSHIDYLACNGALKDFLLSNNWKEENELMCPNHTYNDAKSILIEKRLGENKKWFHFTGEMIPIKIIIPLYERNKHYRDNCIPKFDRVST